MGRIQHVSLENSLDSGVDNERLSEILKRCPVVEVELDKGDAVLFHANLLHSSDDNCSDESRLTLLGCYNTKRNSPYKRTQAGHPEFSYQGSLNMKITKSDLHNLPNFDLMFL